METYRLLDKLKETIQSDFRGKKVSLIYLYGDADNFQSRILTSLKVLKWFILNSTLKF